MDLSAESHGRPPSLSGQASACPLPGSHRLAERVFKTCLLLGAICTGLIPAIAIPDDPEISADSLLRHISILAGPEMRGRRGADKIKARNYIAAEFQQAGLKPLFDDSFLQEVPGRMLINGGQDNPGSNVGGYIPGTDPNCKDEWILVNAHYDHLGVRGGEIYAGADDNASGVAMMLEVSRRIAEAPLRRNVAFVAFDYEESLLWGSRWFAAHPPMPLEQIRCCLTADMISRSLGGLDIPLVFVLGAENSSQLQTLLADLQPPTGLEIGQMGTDMIGTRSDYGPFRLREMPFLFFSTGEHPDYHTPRDTPDRVDPAKAALVSTFIMQVIQAVGDGDEAPEWQPAQHQRLLEARTIHRVAEELFHADERGDITLSNVQRFFVSQVRSRTAFMLQRGKVSEDERRWLVRSAQVMIVTLF